MNLLAGISTLSSLVLTLFGIGFIIGFHELGHFLFCKLFDVRTPSFSIGFGPRIFEKKIGETTFALSAIPLGGYVEIAGSAEVGQGDQEDAHSTDTRSFASKPYYQKLAILLGGILFNMFFAYAALIGLFAAGMPATPLLYPQNATPTVSQVLPNSPAEQAGIKAGDTLLAINGVDLNSNVETLLEQIKPRPHEKVTLLAQREDHKHEVVVELDAKPLNGEQAGFLGAVFTINALEPYGLTKAIKSGIAVTNTIIRATINAFKSLFVQRDLKNVGGPVMLFSQVAQGAHRGIKIFIIMLILVSINLAILNLIPVPILDGGQILFYTIEALIGRPLPENIKLAVHYACWVGIMALTLFLSFRDIKAIIQSWFAN